MPDTDPRRQRPGAATAPGPAGSARGDLRARNRVIGAGGVSWLIDPAAHSGHREFDPAMMRLFGGFGEACFRAHAEVSRLATGWRERIPLHPLAPLVVRALEFGGGHVEGVAAARRAPR